MANNPVKTMPHNLEAEQYLLGAIFLNNEIATGVFETVHESDFYTEANKIVFRAMKEVYNSGNSIELPQVSDVLTKSGEINNIGGMQYLSQIPLQVPSAANYEEYMQIVKRDGVLRTLINCGQKIIEDGYKSNDSVKSLQDAEKLIFEISENNYRTQLEPVSDIVPEVVKKIETLYKDPNAYQGLYSGFKDIDNLLDGFKNGNLIVLGARPGDGKTSLGVNIALNVAKEGKKVAIFELEMVKGEIVERMLSNISSVPLRKVMNGRLTPDEAKDIMVAKDRLKQYDIYIDDSSIATPAELTSKCRSLKRQKGALDLIVIDYAQLMQSGKAEENRQNEVAEVTRKLKGLAKDLNCPVLALCQLNRDANKTKREPQLIDLRESGQIEQDADIVMFIYREDPSSPIVSLKVAKNRSGQTGVLSLYWNGETTTFANADDTIFEQTAQYKRMQEGTQTNRNELVSDSEAPMPSESDIPTEGDIDF